MRAIGPCLQLALGRCALSARLRGDEFGALLGDAMPGARAGRRNASWRRCARLFLLGDLPVYVNVGIGIALCPKHGSDADELIKRADVAMRQAKKSGQGYFLFDRTLERDSAERLALASDRREAIARGELELYFQPKVELRTRRLAKVNALARCRHAQRGVVSPGAFIALAEHTGLIQPLTD